MSSISLPSPHEPFVDLATGKISEVWYRYLTQNEIATNDASTGFTFDSPLTLSTANVVDLAIAAQADEEAGTSSVAVVTPSVQQFHPSAAKAWGSVLLTGTVAALSTGYNVSAVLYTTLPARTGLVVTLTAPFSSSHYSVVSNLLVQATTEREGTAVYSRATTGFTLVYHSTASDAPGYAFICYGDQ